MKLICTYLLLFIMIIPIKMNKDELPSEKSPSYSDKKFPNFTVPKLRSHMRKHHLKYPIDNYELNDILVSFFFSALVNNRNLHI